MSLDHRNCLHRTIQLTIQCHFHLPLRLAPRNLFPNDSNKCASLHLNSVGWLYGTIVLRSFRMFARSTCESTDFGTTSKILV